MVRPKGSRTGRCQGCNRLEVSFIVLTFYMAHQTRLTLVLMQQSRPIVAVMEVGWMKLETADYLVKANATLADARQIAALPPAARRGARGNRRLWVRLREKGGKCARHALPPQRRGLSGRLPGRRVLTRRSEGAIVPHDRARSGETHPHPPASCPSRTPMR